MRFVVLACVWLAAASASAQEEDGRVEFEAGMQLADEGRWADALPHFERAYAVSRAPVALYNVAATLRALGRHVETAASLEELLTHPLGDELRASATAMLDEARSRIATIELVTSLPDPSMLRLRLDSRVLAVPSFPFLLRVDPGVHVLEAEADGHEPFRWEGEAAAGSARTLAIELTPRAPAPALPPEPSVDHGSDDAWAWVLGAVLVVGAAAAVTAVLLTYDSGTTLQPAAGTTVVRL